MKIAITGATGLIGSELVKQCLNQGIEINYLTSKKSSLEKIPYCRGFLWNPTKNEIDISVFEDVSAIIHLAGASVAKRWSSVYKRKIFESRLLSTQLLLSSLQSIDHIVDHYISASGISLYPNSQSLHFSEEYQIRSSSFLSEVVSAWEKKADSFKDVGIKVTKVRTGIVLSRNGGALPQFIRPIKLGVGAAMGNGNQPQSWIHIEDIAGIYLHILNNKLEGVYNGVSPNPSTNKELTSHIATILNKRIWLPNVPEKVMKLALGEMSSLVIEGQWVSSKKIELSGYNFKYKTLDKALTDLL